MTPKSSFSHFFTDLNPSLKLGFFCVATLLLFSACQKEQAKTPDWPQSQQAGSTTPTPQRSDDYRKPQKSQSDTVFVAYNVRNYLNMWRTIDGERRMTGKPENEVTQLIQVIVKSKADILGICEIGEMEELQQLQSLLKKEGLDLPYLHHTGGSDTVRHLAILSKFPIKPNPQPDLHFTMDGKAYSVRRGILDAYVSTPVGDVRFLGIHFKSKREVAEFSQELMRKNEAYTLRRHLTKIHDNPTTAQDKVIVYGDFNDHTRTPAIKAVVGARSSKAHCRPINLKDKHGLTWTHFWSYQDVYGRLDYVMANKAMLPLIKQEKSEIIDVSDHPKASDHRPLKITF